MRIALELEPCCGQRSGIGFYTYELVRRLRSDDMFQFQGNVFDLVGRHHFKKQFGDLPMPIRDFRLMPYSVYHRVWHMLPLPYKAFFPKADVSHFFNYVVPPRISGHVITTIHDLTYRRYPETMNENGLRFLSREMARTMDRCDRLIAVSEFTKSEIMREFGVEEDRIRVVSPDAHVEDAYYGFDYLRKKWNIRENYILYVGNVEPRKNCTRLIEAYKKLRAESGLDSQLVIAGGSAWKSEQIRALAAETPGCLLLGYITEAEKATLYRHAGVMAYVSLYEGFGMPILEAMKLGAPVVCSNTASMPEVAGDAARLVNPTDIVSIGQGLYDVLTDEQLRSTLSERGRINAARYGWDQSVERIRRIYAEFL